ncbi:MAG: hypothetical protein Q9222_000054 [Ikaeria aurantiellina]
MSNSLQRFQSGDHGYPTPQRDSNHGHPAYHEYEGTRTYSSQHHDPSSLGQRQSTNSFAFNANAQFPSSFLYGDQALRIHPGVAGVAGPISHVSSLHLPTLSQESGPFSAPQTLQSIPFTPLQQKMISEPEKIGQMPPSTGSLRGQGGGPNGEVMSDLEDGELSEGADNGSHQPQSDRQSPLNASDGDFTMKHGAGQSQPSHAFLHLDHGGDGTNDTHRIGTNGRGRARPQRRSRLMPAARHVNPDAVESTSATPGNGRHKKSTQALRDGARRAIEQLQLHGIGYSQLLDQHIDPDLLGKLYAELKMDNGRSTQAMTNHTKHKSQQAAAITAVADETTDSPNFPNKSPVPNSNTGESINESRTVDLALKHQHTQNTARNLPKAAAGIQSQHQPDQSQASSKPSVPKGVATKTFEQAAGKGKSELASVEPSGTTTHLSHNENEIKSVSAQVEPSKPRQSLVANMPSKPPPSKADMKTLDRKDYIARLLAAKAGKPPPATTAPKLPINTTAQKMPQDSSPSLKSLAVTVPKPEAMLDSSKKRLDGQSPSEISPNQSRAANAAAEAKKREQTELARRKIEELKNRAKVAKEPSAATSEALAPSVAEQSSQNQKSATKLPAQVSSLLTESPSIFSTPEGSYFPLQSAGFTIPGLFRSSSHSKLETPKEQLPTKPFRIPPSNPERPTPDLDDTSVAAANSDQPSLASESSMPPTHRVERPGNGPVVTAVQHGALTNLRKRPVAADFIEPVSHKVRRYPATKGDSSVIFEISDDEAAESEDGASDVQMTSDQDAKTDSAGDLLTTETKSNPYVNPNHNLPQEKLEQTSDIFNVSNLGSSTPVKPKDSSGLRSKEEEIERMNRKIAEMEQRRKARQVASRAQTPGTPGAITTLPKPSGDQTGTSDQREFDATGQLLEGTFRAADDSTMLADEADEIAGQQNVALAIKTGTTTGAIEEPTLTTEEEQRQLRKAEIESSLPSMDLDLDKSLTRLRSIEKEEADLKAQIQEQIDSKLRLRKELEELNRISLSAATSPRQVENDRTHLHPAIEGYEAHEAAQWVSEPTSPLQASQETGRQPPDGPIANRQRSPSLEDRHPSHEPAPNKFTSESTTSFDAPTDQSMINGELAEDVMDISGSECGDAMPKDKLASQVDAATPIGESDDEELYEPPSSFGVAEQDAFVPADSTTTPADGSETRQGSVPASKRVTSPSENNGMTTVQAATEDVVSATPVPSNDPPSADMSDSDDYEPPEPIASVDTKPLTRPAVVSISQSSPTVLTTDQDATDDNTRTAVPSPPSGDYNRTDQKPAVGLLENLDQSSKIHGSYKHARFTPYESPLQQFHAYRYHPDFISKVGSGYRSLTYSHNIDARKPICPYEIGGRCNDALCEDQHFKSMNLSDDMILVQMGAIPEGLSDEQRNAFVVGLRQIIQEIRGRKVKDFRTVASEIAAYRARFLGDSSKILPL